MTDLFQGDPLPDNLDDIDMGDMANWDRLLPIDHAHVETFLFSILLTARAQSYPALLGTHSTIPEGFIFCGPIATVTLPRRGTVRALHLITHPATALAAKDIFDRTRRRELNEKQKAVLKDFLGIDELGDFTCVEIDKFTADRNAPSDN